RAGPRDPDRHGDVAAVPRAPPAAGAARTPSGDDSVTALPPRDAHPPDSGDLDAPIDTRDALMMAYVDDELGPAEREQFEAMLATDATLAAETAAYRVMCDLATSSGALEPTERELRR